MSKAIYPERGGTPTAPPASLIPRPSQTPHRLSADEKKSATG